MSNTIIPNKLLFIGLLVIILTSSCSLTFPRAKSTSSIKTVTSDFTQIESIKKEEYTVLGSTTGEASTSRYYILFIPIGKHKTNSELFDNAYYAAVENMPNADALILPRQKTKRLTIPLLLFNYNKRTTSVTGVGISVKDKIFERPELDGPNQVLEGDTAKSNEGS